MRRNWVVSGWETRRHRWDVVEEVFQRVGQGLELVTLTQHSNTRIQGWSDTISLTQAQSHIQSVHPSLHIMAFYLLIPSRPHLSCWDIQTSTVATEFWHFPPIGCKRVPCQKNSGCQPLATASDDTVTVTAVTLLVRHQVQAEVDSRCQRGQKTKNGSCQNRTRTGNVGSRHTDAKKCP